MNRRASLPASLVAAGIWETADDGYLIHDYLHYQPSKADVQERRTADRERKKADGIQSGSSRKRNGIR
jgi:hypothetical protein